jgi:diaminopimelate dehydrogenase
VCYARAVYKLSKEKSYGCKTVFDVPPAYLSKLSAEELRKQML